MDTWEIILYDWITMDWGYNDLAVGQVFSSPIAFDYDMLIPSPERRKRAERLGGSAPIYRVTGEISELWLDRGWVLDWGVGASAYGPLPEGLARGDYVTCEIALEIDHPERGVMGAIDWEVRGISRCTAPRRSSRIAPDWEQHTCHPVAETDGWHDGQLRELNVWYVLHCQRSRRDTDADLSHAA